MALSQQFARLEALLAHLDPSVVAFVSMSLRERLAASPGQDPEVFVAGLCDSVEAAGESSSERLRAMSRRPFRAGTPEVPTHTISELVAASDDGPVVGAVAGRVVDTWVTTGYSEYRVSDGGGTLVIGVHGRAPAERPLGRPVIVSVALPKGAQSVTEPLDPLRPSVLGAVAAELIGYREV